MQGPQLDVQATEDGILISLTDRQNFSMFAIGSAEPQPRVLHMMEAIAASLQNLQGPIVVRGHTDAVPTGQRPTTIGGSPPRGRKWRITC